MHEQKEKVELLRKNLEKIRALSELYEDMGKETCEDEIGQKNSRLKMKLCRDELLKLSMETDVILRELARELGKE